MAEASRNGWPSRNPAANHAIIRGAAGTVERTHHEQLCKPKRTIVLLTPPDVCHQRVTQRNRAEADKEHHAIDAWWTTWRAERPDELTTTVAW